MWLHSLKVAQLLRSAACLHTNQSRSYLNHLVHRQAFDLFIHDTKPTKYTNWPLIRLCCNITLNTPTCCSPPGTIFRELKHSSTAYNQISHFIRSWLSVKESSSCNVDIPLSSSVQMCWILVYSVSEAVMCC